MTKQGYKQTEVGLIPQDWEILSIGDSLIFKNGLNKESEFFGYGTPIVNYMDVFNNFGIRRKDIDGKVFLSREEKKNFSAQKGDVFFTRTSETQEEIGTSAVLLESIKDCVFSGFILRGRPKNDIVALEYYQYCLIPQYVRTQIISTSSYTTRALTNGRFLSKVKLVTPPTLTEQKAIATALSDVDGLIASLEQTITKKKAIKQGAMQQLLTPPHKGGKRLPGFSGEWNEIRLGDLIHDFQNGYAFSAIGYEDYGIRIITMAQIGLQGQFQLNESKGNYWDASQLKPLKDFVLKKGDLIMSMTDVTPQKNLIGRMTIIEEKGPFFLNQRVGHLRVNKEKANTIILKHLSNMRSWRTYSKGIASLGVQANIGTTDIKNGTFNLPQIEEQNAIAQILSDMDAEITQLETKKEKYQAIKQGMMQELLTGKTRLI